MQSTITEAVNNAAQTKKTEIMTEIETNFERYEGRHDLIAMCEAEQLETHNRQENNGTQTSCPS